MMYKDEDLEALIKHLVDGQASCAECQDAASALRRLWAFTVTAVKWMRTPAGADSIEAEEAMEKAYDVYLKERRSS